MVDLYVANMPNDRTIFVFHAAGQAEVMQCLLEAHGITATLWDENATRTRSNEAISIALLVSEEDATRAIQILKEEEPRLFAHSSKAAEIDTEIKRSVLRYLVYALASAFVCYFLLDQGIIFFARCRDALMSGFLCAVPMMCFRYLLNRRKRANLK